MAIDELPTVDTFGGTKVAIATLPAGPGRYSAADANAVSEWLVKYGEAIGLDDGSTGGSLRAAAANLSGDITDLSDRVDVHDANLLGATALVTGATHTITTESVLDMVHTAARQDITLPAGTIGREIIMLRAAASAFGVRCIRNGSDKINGASANFDVPGTDAMPTATGYAVYARYVADIVGASTGPTWLVWSDLSPLALVTARVTALEVTGRQIVSGASATVSASTRVLYVDHAAARVDLTLPATPFEPFTIVKRATSGGFAVRLIPASASDAIQGLAANTSFDIPGSTTNASTTTTRPSFLVTSSAVNVVDVS